MKHMFEPEWIVNDLGELGVKVLGKCFFLYKGYSLVYHDNTHDSDGSPMLYRPIGKREFGETQWPQAWVTRGHREDRYMVDLVYVEGLSDGQPGDCDWRQLPEDPETPIFWNGKGLPPVGEKVRFDQAKGGEAIGVVTGYHVENDLKNDLTGNDAVHRVFVDMVYLGTTTPNCRLLRDIKPIK